jgi:hypothetical protein
MTLNPFFLHGSKGEQGLVQNLINEQIRMYGLEVAYIPRKYIKTNNIIREVQSSAFKESFPIEAYVNNYDGYNPGSDIMTKFGISLKNEVSLVISRERFELYIAPLIQGLINYGNIEEGDLVCSGRPKEGDLIYFPLGERLFEIKHVEFENPFYQLGKNYIYELNCELFEYEDEEIDTNIEELQEKLSEKGYITTLTLVSLGTTATAQVGIGSTGVVNQITLTNDGYNYTSSPSIVIDEPPLGGEAATAIAITTAISGSFRAITDIQIVSGGFGYEESPNVTITGGGGTGATAISSIADDAVYRIDVINSGEHYYETPTVTIGDPIGGGTTATAIANISVGGTISNIYITNGGSGYTSIPAVTISNPPLVGFGTYILSEVVIGQKSGANAVVKKWTNPSSDADKNLEINIVAGEFLPGEVVLGTESSAQYSVKDYDQESKYDKYTQSQDFQEEGEKILDNSEDNLFGFI